VIGGAALKWGFLFAKFFAFFVSFAAYSFWFGSWKFGLGFVLLILVHETRPRRRGDGGRAAGVAADLHPVLRCLRDDAGTRILAVGRARLARRPFLGGLGAAAVVGRRASTATDLLLVLANIGFLLNAVNLLPIGFLDGGSRLARREGHVARLRSATRTASDRGRRARPRRPRAIGRSTHARRLLVGAMLATRHSGML
jgi:Zn-dependent protease